MVALLYWIIFVLFRFLNVTVQILRGFDFCRDKITADTYVQLFTDNYGRLTRKYFV